MGDYRVKLHPLLASSISNGYVYHVLPHPSHIEFGVICGVGVSVGGETRTYYTQEVYVFECINCRERFDCTSDRMYIGSSVPQENIEI